LFRGVIGILGDNHKKNTSTSFGKMQIFLMLQQMMYVLELSFKLLNVFVLWP